MKRRTTHLLRVRAAAVIITTSLCAAIAVGVGCGGGRDGFNDTPPPEAKPAANDQPSNGDNGGFGSTSSGGVTPPPPCVGLQCNQVNCGAGALATSTTVSGVVYDPAGKNPLYNVVVYVPNAPITALPEGATCDKCDALYSGSPLVATTTDAKGKFTLKNMPVGTDIPLVVQVGKWRRAMKVPTVTKCVDTPLADGTVRLPKNRSEGNIPNIAISTGSADSLECLLRRVGIDASEYGGGAGGQGRIHIFAGGATVGPFGVPGVSGPNTSPAGPSSSSGLWSSKGDLMKYDMVLLSCEGTETLSKNQQALFDYAASGGRVFSSHLHYAWFNSGPFGNKNLASWKPGANDMGDISGKIVTTLANGAPFAKGQALKDWLGTVNALNASGDLAITSAKDNAEVTASHTSSQAWIKASAAAATQYFTFNTPLGAKPDDQCGRVVFSDLHVGAASGDYTGSTKTVPDGCGTGELSAQEKALEFMLFDLSSCVTPDDQPPPPPPGSVK